jgi:hypothetical protein
MAWRFRRRIRIAPGFDVNLGKRGASLSVGVRGLHTTFGKRTRTTIGLPGTGLSYTTASHRRRRSISTEEQEEPGSDVGSAFAELVRASLQLIKLLPPLAFWGGLLWLLLRHH